MSGRIRFRTPKHTLSTRPASAPNETSFYEEIPATDVYYREYFDGGMVLTHEDREKVGSPEHSIRVEIMERYGTGFSRGKLAAAHVAKSPDETGLVRLLSVCNRLIKLTPRQMLHQQTSPIVFFHYRREAL